MGEGSVGSQVFGSGGREGGRRPRVAPSTHERPPEVELRLGSQDLTGLGHPFP